MNTPLELAQGLQHSNEPSVAKLAKGMLTLNAEFERLKAAYIKVCGENVMIRHENLFKKLAESGD